MHLAFALLAQVGWPEDGLTKSQAENLFLAGAIICGLAIIFVLRQVSSVTTRLLWVAILAVLTGFMVWQRQEVQDCSSQCSCELMGRELAIHDDNAFCP